MAGRTPRAETKANRHNECSEHIRDGRKRVCTQPPGVEDITHNIFNLRGGNAFGHDGHIGFRVCHKGPGLPDPCDTP
jgi:hypothetical protein